VAVSQREREMLQRAFRNRPVALGHLPVFEGFRGKEMTAEAAREVLGLPAGVPILLAFGFVRKYKGLRFLLRALAQVPQPAHLIVAGEFWESEADYRRLISELGLDQRVTLHNRYIHNEAIEPYFAAANGLVLPYLSGTQSGAGMLGLHFALPIIATKVGGLAETVVHGANGLIVPPGDAEALAAAIRRFLTEDLEAPMREAAARARDRLSWPALVAIIEDLTHELKRARDLPVGPGADLQRSRHD
jgi:glycosyltransferase involved in cell wall biosynthesis